MDDDLDEVRAVLQRRIDEIRPLVEQLPRLERALAALEGREPAARPPAAGSPPARGAKPAARRPGTRLSAEERHEQILAALRRRPGQKTTDLVGELGVSRVRISQLTGTLIEQGLVRKDADGRLSVA